jgi:hypothetical protein
VICCNVDGTAWLVVAATAAMVWCSATERSSATADNPVLIPALVAAPPLANELAVGAKSLDEDNTLFLSLVPATTFDPVLPTSASRPTLPLVPRDDTRDPEPNPNPALLLVATEDRVAIDEDDAGPVIELFRLPTRELVPIEEATLLLLLPLPEIEGTGAPVNDGMGDLTREEVVEVNPALFFSLSLVSRMEGALLGLAPARDVEGRPGADASVGAIETFFTGWIGACLCARGLDTGMLDAASAGAFPRFHTFWTMDFAEERKPKRDGLGLSGSSKNESVNVRISSCALY